MQKEKRGKNTARDLGFYISYFTIRKICNSVSEEELNERFLDSPSLMLTAEEYPLLVALAEKKADEFRNDLVAGLKKTMEDPYDDPDPDPDDPVTPEKIESSWRTIREFEAMSPREFGSIAAI